MNIDELERLEVFEKEYWWHKGREFLIVNLIEKYLNGRHQPRILDIGCGTGGILSKLRNSYKVVGIDKSEAAIKICKTKLIPDLILGDINTCDLEIYNASFDCILALDALEHIQEDLFVLKKIKKLLSPNGKLIITVPAHKFLWSEHDEALQHKRRYHSVELKQKIVDSGYKIEKFSYFVFFAFFPITFYRTWNTLFRQSTYPISSYVKLPKFLNNFGYLILKVETNIVLRTKLPIGTTLVAVCSNN